ncbi:fungal-specific transcription factor domain-domain-containing protein [Coniella lustricola]|uniref:Fungal-specific transcription factor domain-domain-containing protein n=1 Tax=Coniella lustricola TaxID=2025994 RepID=A0A2T3A158_9PEZI|nr:fungal-specific transcription factor domain-domain-containing protein [Coniella lustricola]
MSDQHERPNIDDLTPEEASRIIHSHRKVRYGTACWPCRQRKVKCDNKEPCDNCVKREHPQLCSYKPNRSAKASVSESTGHVSKKRALSIDDNEQILHEMSSEPKPDPVIRSFVDAESAEVSRYLGQNSIPALLREQSSTNDRQEGVDYIRQDMRSILGLDNSAPFPLMSSRHLERLTADISAELPSDREVYKLFRTYKEIPQVFWGFVMDIDDLESKLMDYLEERAKNAKSDTKAPRKPVSASWLAILFAVLAVGSQYHDSPYHIRTSSSQKYLQISFHFLRVGNFLLRPNFDSIQALLLVSFSLLNDMKAEGSWALLGLTCRLALSLGLHRVNPYPPSDPAGARKDNIRRKLWWCCLWHDTLTSLSFDRAPMTSIPCCPIPLAPRSETEGLTYLEAMYHLCELINRRLNPDALVEVTYLQIIENCQAIEQLRDRVIPQIRSKEACKSAVDRLQHFAIRLHTSFAASVCSRPALKRSQDSNLSSSERKVLASKCKENLTETVRMFLAMHQLSVIPTRSWAFTYHGLSSAVLLGLLHETKTDPEIRQLQGDLISALSATAAKDQTSPKPHIPKTDKDIELSGPLSRALVALKNIYDHGHIMGSALRRENGTRSGTRTPLAINQVTNHIVPSADGADPAFLSAYQQSSGLSGNQSLDPHQDAALAMAEMQNGNAMGDMAGLPFAQPAQPPLPMGDMGSLDANPYIEPMELYDSIFWESPDPWNSGVDAMSFDFLAQPPPGQPPQQQFYF